MRSQIQSLAKRSSGQFLEIFRILRDKSFGRMTVAEWDIIHRVHLRGSFLVTKAVWEHMRKQKYGRIIMTSSAAGIYGNFGQTNYSAAKLGLVGLANSLALEGRKYNININSIAPIAGTRLTQDIVPPDVFEALKPEYAVPVVMWLCHDQCQETGGLFESGGGYLTKLRWQRTDGAALREKGKKMLPEHVRDNWEKVTDFSKSHVVDEISQSTVLTGEQVSRIEAGDNDIHSNHPIQPKLAKAHVSHPFQFEYGNTEVILYALGVGASTNQPGHLDFLFELSENFSTLPTFGVIPGMYGLNSLTSGTPGININPGKILHGEQYIELFKPIPTEGKLTSNWKIVEIMDKGSGAAIVTDVETFDESGEKIFFNQSVIFAVGYGNFGGARSSPLLKETCNPPKRAPDSSIAEKTNKDQAALYRLSGDRNPLHIDPSFAAIGGFKTPILHGLCSFGYAARHVMMKYADNDPTKIKAVKTRFAKPVLPGQTLRTEMWKEGSRVFFRTIVEETGTPCLTGGYVDLFDGSAPAETQAPPPKQEEASGDKLQSDTLFEGLKNMLNADIVNKVKAVFQWNITKDGSVARKWALDLKSGAGSVNSGSATAPDCTLTISDNDAMQMFNGKLNPQMAFMQGRFKISGNVMVAQKLDVLFKSQAKL